MIHHITRATRHLIFWSLIAIAITSSGMRLLLYGIERYKADLETQVSDLLGAPVTIGRLGARIRGLSPELVLKDIDISTKDGSKPAVQLEQIRVGIDLLKALQTQQLLSSSWVALVGAKLSVKRKIDGSFTVVGLQANNDDSQPLWLLQGRKYEVLRSEITWQDEKRHGKPIVFDAVDLAIINEGAKHTLNLLASMPKKYGDLLRISAEFTGNVFKPDAIQGTVYVEGKHLKLAKLITGDLPLAVRIDSGISDFAVWAQVEKSQLISVQGDVQFQELKLRRTDRDDFFAKMLKTQFYWAVKDDRWQLLANDLSLQYINPSDKSIAVFGLTGTQSTGTLQRAALWAERLDLPVMTKALLFFAPLTDEQSTLLKQAQLKGRLEKFTVSAQLANALFQAEGRFAGVGLSYNEGAISLDNLSGLVKGNDKQGRIQWTTENGHFAASTLFRDRLTLNKLTGAVEWIQTPTQWSISSPLIELNVPVINSKTRLALTLPKTVGAPFLDIQTDFSGDDISKVTQYLPVGIMKENVVNWLDKAFVKGKVSQGRFQFYGKPADFPFKNRPGVFEALFDVEQMTLAYQPNWPVITDVNAHVLFSKDSLEVSFRQGQTEQLKVLPTLVKIPSLSKDAQLIIDGALEGSIADALTFMRQSPLKARVDTVLQAIQPVGNTKITLGLHIPLNNAAATKVQGEAQFDDGSLTVKAVDLAVKRLKGALKFNEQGVYSDTMTAETLQYPISIKIDQASQKTVIHVSGRAAIENLQQQFPLPGWDIFSGASDYDLQLDLPDNKAMPQLRVQSDLVGIAFNLPDMLAKKELEKKPLLLKFDLNSSNTLPVSIEYDNQLKMALKVNRTDKTLESAQILIGQGEVTATEIAGITVDIKRDRLILQDWLALAATQASGGTSKTPGTRIKSVKLSTPHGMWQETDLGLFNLSLIPEKTYWSGTLNADIAKGRFQLPYDVNGSERIKFTMDRVDFSVLKSDTEEKPTVAKVLPLDTVPAFRPLLSVFSKQTFWQGTDLGQLTIESERKLDGIAIKRVDLTSHDHTLSATGDWKITGNQSETVLKGHWDIPKAGAFFNQIDLSQDFSDTHAKVDFSLNWKAAPQQFALAKLKGQLDVHFNQGRILSIEPGLGRVLGVLAMAQWIKRLQLDFSDVFQDGLSYNRIDGHFDIINGKVVTKNLVIDAIPATITLVGETDLVSKTVAYTVQVVPNSADAVPIAGTIVGRVASMMAKTLTGKNQDGFLFGSSYQIKGEWGNVKISQLHGDEGLLQKTWHGLTDFSWLK